MGIDNPSADLSPAFEKAENHSLYASTICLAVHIFTINVEKFSLFGASGFLSSEVKAAALVVSTVLFINFFWRFLLETWGVNRHADEWKQVAETLHSLSDRTGSAIDKFNTNIAKVDLNTILPLLMQVQEWFAGAGREVVTATAEMAENVKKWQNIPRSVSDRIPVQDRDRILFIDGKINPWAEQLMQASTKSQLIVDSFMHLRALQDIATEFSEARTTLTDIQSGRRYVRIAKTFGGARVWAFDLILPTVTFLACWAVASSECALNLSKWALGYIGG